MLTLLPHRLDRPLAFSPDAADVADMLASVMTGWPMSTGSSASQSLLNISASGAGILIERAADGAIFREPSAVSAVCSLVVEVVDALAAASPGLVCLHAAAAEFGGRLLLFPAAHRAGKSTLMARLSMAGRRIFADDILPFDIATGEAVSTGCLPRLRLPLPHNSHGAFQDHVREKTVISDGYYAYLSAREGAGVRFGDRLPLGAVVLLERSETPTPAALKAAPLDKALLEILMRNTRRDRDAALLLSTFAAIIRDVPVLRLVYSDLEDAVGCLEAAFAEGSPPIRRKTGSRPAARKPRAAPVGKARAPKAGGILYGKNPGVTADRIDGSGFLLDPRDNAIHVLDPLGLGVWTLLDVPRSASDLADIVAAAFPHAPRQQVAADVGALLSALAEKGLVEEQLA